MRFYNALGAIRSVLQDNPDVYVVNEGANALDLARNVIDMELPRHRLDTGTWGVMGIGMGYAIAAAVETGKPVVAIEGDSAFGFSGMEIETICRYRLPVTVVILNNGGVYRGDEATAGAAASGSDPAPTVLNARARHELLAEAFGGKGYHVNHPIGAARGADRGDRLRGAVDRRLRTRPGGGGRKRASGQPQPGQRGHSTAGRGQRRRVSRKSCASKNSSSASWAARANALPAWRRARRERLPNEHRGYPYEFNSEILRVAWRCRGRKPKYRRRFHPAAARDQSTVARPSRRYPSGCATTRLNPIGDRIVIVASRGAAIVC